MHKTRVVLVSPDKACIVKKRADYFNYCAQTWHFCNKASAEKLEKVNERAVRFVFRDKRTLYEEPLSVLGRRTLLEQRLQKIFCTLYNLVNHYTNPESLSDLILNTKRNDMCLERKGHSDNAKG